MAAAMYGLNVLSLHIQDAQAALDVLASRPEVDAARIGCIGNSYGGRTSMWFTIFDPRIRACVASGCMNTFRERSLKLSSCGIQYLPGLLRYGDVPELFCLIAPRPLQLQAGERDALITPSDRDAIQRTVREAYQGLDAGACFDYVLHEEGHLLLWEQARAFLDRHL
jgi:dienelactone hydrolase